MLFNSLEFIVAFLPVAVAGFVVLAARSRRAAIAWLALASILFYAWWDVSNLPILLGSVAVNYAIGRIILGAKQAGGRPALGHAALVAGIAVNLGLLGYFKYAFFIAGEIGVATVGLSLDKTALPLAISFFTFQQIAFLVDCRRGAIEDFDALEYVLVVGFFPHLIAGPIVRYRELMAQFHVLPPIRGHVVAQGLTLFAIGLVKKVILADGIAPYSTELFSAALEAGAAPTFFEAWAGALAYTLQIYFDFSGYCDMAVGAALLFGIRLPFNFDSPYKARSIIDFWRRWHMTLSQFLRDYLYVPLGGNRRGPARLYINVMIVMVLGGLWHGAAWTFVAWGALHGAFLLINHAWRHWRGNRPAAFDRWGSTISWLATLLAVIVAWVFFRAESFAAAMNVLEGMAGLNGVALGEKHVVFLGPLADVLRKWGVAFLPATTLSVWSIPWIVIGFAICLGLPNSQEWVLGARRESGRAEPRFDPMMGRVGAWAATRGWAIVMGFAAAVAIGLLSRPSEFLYFNF